MSEVKWPEDGKSIMFNLVVDPIIKFGEKYLFTSEDVEYEGYEQGKYTRATCLGGDHLAHPDHRERLKKEYGAMRLFTDLAVHMGIEIGRRQHLEEMEDKLMAEYGKGYREGIEKGRKQAEEAIWSIRKLLYAIPIESGKEILKLVEKAHESMVGAEPPELTQLYEGLKKKIKRYIRRN